MKANLNKQIEIYDARIKQAGKFPKSAKQSTGTKIGHHLKSRRVEMFPDHLKINLYGISLHIVFKSGLPLSIKTDCDTIVCNCMI